MLVEFRVQNFRSFRDEQVLSMVASPDAKLRDNLVPEAAIPGRKMALLKCAVLYGPNASGKSNLITAIETMRALVLSSATRMNLGDKLQGIVPFRLDSDSGGKPSLFEVSVVLGETHYIYGFTATTTMVYDEWLYALESGKTKFSRWLERRLDVSTKSTQWFFGGPMKEEMQVLKARTRPNGLALSRAAEQNVSRANDLFLWFRHGLSIISHADPAFAFADQTSMRIKDDQELQRQVSQLLQHADLGIDSLRVVEKPVDMPELPDLARSSSDDDVRDLLKNSFEIMRRIMSRQPKALPMPFTVHHTCDTGSEVLFDLWSDESKGTQRLFSLSGPLLKALSLGTTVVADELDCSMHSLLTRRLIELFQSPEANKKGAQLVFATHDVTLMDKDLFRRDQIWLIENTHCQGSQLYSLYDFEEKPRNTEAFQRRYLSGRYGAVPRFGPMLEDQEIE